MSAPVPQTKLDAVNAMLGTVWETPVAALDVGGIASLSLAVRIFDETVRAIQSRGWAFNTEHNYPLPLDMDSKCPLPLTTLAVDTEGQSAQLDVVKRGLLLYDRCNHTYTFSQGPVYVKIVLGIDYEECPETFKQYVTMMAARRFKAQYLQQPEEPASAAEVDALRNLEEDEADVGDFNVVYDNPTGYTIARR